MGWLLWLLRRGFSLCCRHPVSCGDGEMGGHTATGPLLPWTAGRGREGCMYQAGVNGEAGGCMERANGGRSGLATAAPPPPDAAHQEGNESAAACGAHVSSGFFCRAGFARALGVGVGVITNLCHQHTPSPPLRPTCHAASAPQHAGHALLLVAQGCTAVCAKLLPIC